MISSQNKSLGSIFIIGSGEIGCRIARHWGETGAELFTLNRSGSGCPNLASTHIRADLDTPDSLEALTKNPSLKGCILYYLTPPPPLGTQDLRMGNFLNSLRDKLPKQIIYISTSGVYGDCNGELVDENRPPNPGTERSQRRLNAEQQLHTWGKQHQCPITILRVGGIYGPGRLPLSRLEKGMAVLRCEDAPYSNRIHSEDLATICVAAADSTQDFVIYNVSDGHPTSMSDYFLSVAKASNLPLPKQISWSEAEQQLSPEMLSYLKENKQLDNSKLLTELGIALRYPTLAEGLTACDI